ncbi:hypothetical protein QQF64_029180 [Cirrhinus molitorella]|uniref:Uncharacterized protein n=1 Tax=Cirrhinus molitorella TaxID=172907 RepID=A0ABR3N8N4_9TELE
MFESVMIESLELNLQGWVLCGYTTKFHQRQVIVVNDGLGGWVGGRKMSKTLHEVYLPWYLWFVRICSSGMYSVLLEQFWQALKLWRLQSSENKVK